MNDAINKILASFDPALLESDRSKAKKLLKSDKMAQGKDEHARGMRAYLRAVASGRDAAYLLTQKGKIAEGAKHAKKLLGEDVVEVDLFERMSSAEKALMNKINAITKGWGDGWPHWHDADPYEGDPAGATFEFEFDQHAKKFAQKAKALGAKVSKPKRNRQHRSDRDPGPKFMWEVSLSLPKAVTEDFTAAELDAWWSGARPKLIKGSRGTRHRRRNTCVKSLRALRDGGIKVTGLSHTDKNPVPRKERDSEDQPVDRTPGKVDEDIHIEEIKMNLNDAIARFRSLDEANIPAPSVDRAQPGGGSQYSSKSKFKYYGGADQDYHGGKIGIPADAPAKAAMSHSSSVKGPVGADAREVVDVRIEDIDPDQLVAMLEQIAEAADSLEEYAQLIETHLGFDMVCQAFKLAENVENPELLLGRIYEGVTNPVQGDGPVVDNPMSEHNRGVGTDDFVENGTDAEDHAFAMGMMRGETTDAGLSGAELEEARKSFYDGIEVLSKMFLVCYEAERKDDNT